MAAHRQGLIKLLAELAYREGDIVLSSGRPSRFYLDAKQVTYHPRGVEMVGRAVLEQIRAFDAQGVGGLTMGADAVVASTVWAANAANLSLPGFVVRKEAKGHGLGKVIEGVCPARGSRVAIVDDVATSGGSLLRAINAAREHGLEVCVVVPLVDREEGAAESLKAEGVAFRPVCTVSEVRAAFESQALAV